MNMSERCISLGRIALIIVLSALLGLAVFLFSRFLISDSKDDLNKVFAMLAALCGLLCGAVLILSCILINRLKTLETARLKAVTDGLTELYNRSFLDPFLDHQIEDANRTNHQVSVIMVDLDHFKDINDTYGHEVGDHVLTVFAHAVLKCMRKTDIISRYGGDEFLVVLPKTDTETAEIIADRIRQEVSDTYIPPIDGVVISSVNCSVGISTYPLHCDSKKTLIRTSDIALYMAKHSGRNCTRVYQNGAVLN